MEAGPRCRRRGRAGRRRDEFEVITDPASFEAVKKAVDAAGSEVHLEAKVGTIPQNTVKLERERRRQQMLKLMEKLEDNDDVQNVYANFDIPDDDHGEAGVRIGIRRCSSLARRTSRRIFGSEA
ncbi:MAG: YebC/PmpR family DNA-binding transcriptional regulator [Desulfosudis oleivorans]|nr:YebC/PmpR family DNA-binding transcriptional regulator [Desulfosudis oleivorans]